MHLRTWNLELCEEASSHPDVLKLRHEFAVKATHRVSGQEPGPLGIQVVVDLFQVGQQVGLGRFVLLQKHDLELGVYVLNFTRNLKK